MEHSCGCIEVLWPCRNICTVICGKVFVLGSGYLHLKLYNFFYDSHTCRFLWPSEQVFFIVVGMTIYEDYVFIPWHHLTLRTV